MDLLVQHAIGVGSGSRFEAEEVQAVRVGADVLAVIVDFLLNTEKIKFKKLNILA